MQSDYPTPDPALPATPTHLTPDDIEFLLDGDEGFATFPLRKHLALCGDCRMRLAEARSLVETLERLPYAAPSPAFAERVMARVNVFEPWYVTLLDTLRRNTPRSRALRVTAGIGAASMAATLSALVIWASIRVDLAIYAVELGWTRVQSFVTGAASSAMADLFGDTIAESVQTGKVATIGLAAGATLVVLIVTLFGLRRMVARGQRIQTLDTSAMDPRRNH
jgi:hypothetical protein